MQQTFQLCSNIKIIQKSLDEVRQSYELPTRGKRWLHHSLLCSKAHDMSFTEFVEELGKTVKREESNLLECYSLEQYRNQAWTIQVLLYSIREVLLSKFHSSGGLLSQGTGLDVGTTDVAARPCLPLNAESSTTRDAQTVTGARNDSLATETTDATLQISRNVGSETITGSETGVETVDDLRGNKAKRLRDSSPARVSRSISGPGLTIGDFGDLGCDYNAALERASESKFIASAQDPGKSSALAERKHDGLATSGGGVSKYGIRSRQNRLKKNREQYYNQCVSLHCEAVTAHSLINNPFVKTCRSCSLPSAGDLLC